MSTFEPSLLSDLPDIELISARPLTGGLSNRCWMLELRDRRTSNCFKAVWRPIAASSTVFGLSREREHQVLANLESSSLAPRSIALLNQGLLVEWLEGTTADDNFSVLELLTLQLAIHSLPAPCWRLDVKQKAAHYWKYIDDRYKSPLLQQIFNHFQHLPLVAWFEDTCCHHDLGRYNIICQPGSQSRVIDWEYAAAGDPSLDLALTISANGLEREQAVATYCELHGNADYERWLAAVTAWEPWCLYLAMLWYYVGATLWPDEGYQVEADSLAKALSQVSV